MVEKEDVYSRRDPASEPYMLGVREKHGLNLDASMDETRPVATRLLGDNSTRLAAAELVLNRRVSISNETMIGQILMARLPPEEKYGLLVMERMTEDAMREKGITNFGTNRSLFD